MNDPPLAEDAIASHLLDALRACGEILLMDHTNPWELDEALCAAGFAVGLCEAQDVQGLDHDFRRRKNTPVNRRHIPILNRMVAEGRLGRKTGVGWYRYPGGGGLVIDPLVEDLLREEAWFAGVSRVELSDDVLVEYMQLALINASAALLDQGDETLAQRINDVAQHRLGVPEKWGGVLTLGDTIGPAEVCRQLDNLAQGKDAFWRAHPALRRRAGR